MVTNTFFIKDKRNIPNTMNMLVTRMLHSRVRSDASTDRSTESGDRRWTQRWKCLVRFAGLTADRPGTITDEHYLPFSGECIMARTILSFPVSVYVIGHTDAEPKPETVDPIDVLPHFVGISTSRDIQADLIDMLMLFKDDTAMNAACINVVAVFPHTSPHEAYTSACELYHRFHDMLVNDFHPERPLDSGWRCPQKNCRYKPNNSTLPVRTKYWQTWIDTKYEERLSWIWMEANAAMRRGHEE